MNGDCTFNSPKGVQQESSLSSRVPSNVPLKLLDRISRFSSVTLSKTYIVNKKQRNS